MNKLVIPNGGMPLHGNDFEWIHSGVFEALKGAVSLFGATSSGNFIISGCEASLVGPSVSITEGFACIGWEICYCPAQSITAAAIADVSIKLVQTFDPTGSELFADAVARDTYAVRRGMISTGSVPTEINLVAPVRLPGRMTDIVASQEVVQDVTTFQSLFSSNPANPLRVRRLLNTAYIEGEVLSTAGTSTTTDYYAFDIPAGFWPTHKRSFLATNPFRDQYKVVIWPTGTVYIQPAEGYDDFGDVTDKGVFFGFSWRI